MIKKLLLVGWLFMAFPAAAQLELGVKFSPLVNYNRVNSTSDTLAISSNGAALRFSVGLVADYSFQDNYFFSSGLMYVTKRARVESESNSEATRREETYNLQYLQIPITLKLLTNEIALDKRIYVQLGGNLDMLIDEKAEAASNILVQDFRFFDFSLFLGTGMEMKLGVSTSLFVGVSYTRGLVNIVAEQAPLDGDLEINNDYFGLDLGIKF